ASTTTTVRAPATAPTADLVVTQSASPGETTVGSQNVAFTVTVTNDGPTIATQVRLTEILPTGAAFVSATGGITPSHGSLTFVPGNSAPGATVTYTIVVRPLAVVTLTATATVLAAETDPSPANNSAVASARAVSPEVVTQLYPLVPLPDPIS